MPVRRLASLLLPPLLMMGVIFLLSAQPSHAPDREWWEIVLRKLAHVSEYALLVLAWWRAIDGLWRPRRPELALVAAAAVAIAYAGTDELHQTFVDGSTGTPVDVMIDAIGVVIAGAAASAYARWRRTVGPSRPSAA